jgi:hypothetical protein
VRISAWFGFGTLVALLLGAGASTASDKNASARRVLEILSPDRGDCTLRLEWSWGAMAVNHVMLDDHQGSFKVFAEATGNGVRVRFVGWGKEPFVATANKEVRIIYWVAGRKEIGLTVEAASAREVRVRSADRGAIQGRNIVIGFGEPGAQGVAKVFDQGKAN